MSSSGRGFARADRPRRWYNRGMKTTSRPTRDQPISPERTARYRAGLRRRQAEADARLHARFKRAWELARAGADALRSRFGATEVLVFGSLTDESRFDSRSDIDLAARGIREEDYLDALGALFDVSTEFLFDLVLIEHASPRLQRRIEENGLPL